MQSFRERIGSLPHLGIGVSTEYGASGTAGALDILGLRRHDPGLASFLEVGVEVSKGLDADTESWITRRLPTTYHFLDVNLDEPDDFDAAWLASMHHFVQRLNPAWMCGDAGQWHFGRRDRGHMLLLPPILSDENATAIAEGVMRLRTVTGLEILPENPPGSAYLGDLHLLDFYRRVIERADTGMLLDCAHLAIYQRMTGRDPLSGLADFPLDHVVEMHVAGGAPREIEGFHFVEDSHTPAVLDATWTIFEYVAARAPELRAVVFECERNPMEECLPGFAQIRSILARVAAAPKFRGASGSASSDVAGSIPAGLSGVAKRGVPVTGLASTAVGSVAAGSSASSSNTANSDATSADSVVGDSVDKVSAAPLPARAGARYGLGLDRSAIEENGSRRGAVDPLLPAVPTTDLPTYIALQRVVVRMLHDPSFVDVVFAEPNRALDELPVRERTWVIALDRRSYRTDPARAARVLAGVLEEFPVAAAHLVRAFRDPHLLETFFSSSVFHRGIQEGESISVLFGRFLLDLAVQDRNPVLIDLARFETAIALVRRERGDEAASTWQLREEQATRSRPESRRGSVLRPLATQSTEIMRLSPRCAVLRVETPTLANYSAMRAVLHGQTSDVTTPFDPGTPPIFDLDLPWPVPADGAATTLLLTGVLGPELGMGGGQQVIDVQAEEVSTELGQVLLHARSGSARASLLELLREHGAEPREDEEILAEFVRDGLLVPH